MKPFSQCTEKNTRSKIKVHENKSNFMICNPSRLPIEKIQIDGCVMGDQDGMRCDYMFVIPADTQHQQRVFYVELKGTDIKQAGRQLIATLQQTMRRYPSAKKTCFIVTTRIPSHGTKVQEFKIDFKNKYSTDLKVQNNIIIESV